MKRVYKLTVMLSEEELAVLRTAAERQGLTVSDFLRQYIRQFAVKKLDF